MWETSQKLVHLNKCFIDAGNFWRKRDQPAKRAVGQYDFISEAKTGNEDCFAMFGVLEILVRLCEEEERTMIQTFSYASVNIARQSVRYVSLVFHLNEVAFVSS